MTDKGSETRTMWL